LSATESELSKYIKRVCQEITHWGRILNRCVDSIYFGGGTPSLIGSDNILKILNSIKEHFDLKYPEVTVEVNPGDYSILDFEKLSLNGVNRISVGVQSLEEHELKVLGRRHSLRDVYITLENIKRAGINNISVDFILGVPDQTLKSLDKALDFCSKNKLSHVSAYLLKIEEGTSLFKNIKQYNFLSDDACSDLYMYFSEKMKSLGYNHYEISNFASPGFESRHNCKYWNLEEYLGLGPSAHSMIEKKRFYYPNSLEDFNFNKGYILEGCSRAEEEYAMLRLRLSEGIKNEDYKLKFNKDIPEEYFKRAKAYEGLGLIKCSKNGISLTEKGFLLSNSMIGKILY